MVFVSLPLLWFSIRHLKFWSAFGIGLIGGFAFYCAQLPWLSFYLGPVPWLALSLLEALIFALGMAITAVVWPLTERFGVLAGAATLATLWTSREWASTRFPYGGFPWSTLSQTQSESPLANWVYWGGFDFLSFVVAFIAAIVLLTVLRVPAWLETRRTAAPRTSNSGLGRWRAEAITGAAVALCFAIPLATQPPIEAEAGAITLAAVQGNANAGLFSNVTPGGILDKHVAATDALGPLLEAADPAFPKASAIIWPENSGDLSPLTSTIAASKVRSVLKKFGLPLIMGTYRFDEADNVYNTSLFYSPDGKLRDYYDKQKPVPFAEYVPNREFWYSLAPDLVGLISHGYSAGSREGIFNLDGAKLGIEICFEVAIGDISHNLLSQGAQVLVVQTNSSDFGRSAEMFQQAAYAKLRAIETGRSLVAISTVGVSAMYLPNGQVIDSLQTFEPGVMLKTLPLRDSQTPAFWVNPPFLLLTNLFSLFAFALALLLAARRRLSTKNVEEPESLA
jgi:apolipoprotein N-acyltransferase